MSADRQSNSSVRLVALVQSFVAAVQSGKHREQGWGNSNYGMPCAQLGLGLRVFVLVVEFGSCYGDLCWVCSLRG